jgi:hypothetical protein
MAMSEKDWDDVKNALKDLYNSVVLDCDGFRLRLHLGRIDTYRNAIMVFVDDWFRGEWLLNDCEQRRRFLRPVKISAHSKGYRQKIKKLSARELKILGIDPHKAITVYDYKWPSFPALRRHLERNNQSITLIREDDSIDAGLSPALGYKESKCA